MILLDENIPEDQCRLLRRRRLRFRQIGQDVGRQGMKDEQQILPLLHKLKRTTFFTRDLGFFDRRRCHGNYAIVCLAVGQKEAARYIRRFLRLPSFKSGAKRMGAVVWASASGLRVLRLQEDDEKKIQWLD